MVVKVVLDMNINNAWFVNALNDTARRDNER